MADISPDTPRPEHQAKDTSYAWLELAVPLFSFGGALLAIIFWISGAPFDFRISIAGCVLASWALAYLAWIRPKKDIVALSTPIYSFIFISITTDIFSTVVLEILYAVSLTLLLVRLKYRFGAPGTPVTRGMELGGSLKTYVGRTRDEFSTIRPETAHAAALAFIRFAEGNYEHAEQISKTALVEEENPDSITSLMRAFSIITEHSALLHNSLPRPMTFQTFTKEDFPLLARQPVPVQDDDTAFYAALDNALLMVYSAAWSGSEQDRRHLLACQVFAQKLMSLD